MIHDSSASIKDLINYLEDRDIKGPLISYYESRMLADISLEKEMALFYGFNTRW
jgi:hypothetical protein